jgi:hypothetical protein
MSVYSPIDDNVSTPGALVSKEAFEVLANNINYLIDSLPVGSIRCFVQGIPGMPDVDPSIWQECDGTAITNEFSELRGAATPDYRAAGGRYMRGFTNGGTIGNYGGSNTKTLNHSHGGQTNVSRDDGDGGNGEDSMFPVGPPHSHGVPSDLGGTYNFEPVYTTVRHYIKIR